jgi:hypothetical protein
MCSNALRWRARHLEEFLGVASIDSYRLAVSPAYRLLVFGVMLVMSLFGAGMIVSAVRGTSEDLPLLVVVLWCSALVWNWHVLLGIPYEIRFETANRISFVSLARTVTLSTADLRSIKPYGGAVGFYLLRHDGGKIRLLSQFTGFHEIVSRIKAANPNFDIVGI